MKKIILYTTPSCPFCAKTKEFLRENRIAYEDFNVMEDEQARDEMMKKSGKMTVPVIDIEGEIIVGFEPEQIKKALEE